MQYLGISSEKLEGAKAFWTASEIAQQPEMILSTQSLLCENMLVIENFLRPLLKLDGLRIVLTGAGTSAFIGECLTVAVAKSTGCRCEAISTTDLVSSPGCYFEEKTPTLLVSFGRSGNSPESVAAVNMANENLENVYHLILTCNAKGGLAIFGAGQPNAHVIVLPEKTHDKSFAMTSSFTSMMYAAMACFIGISDMQSRAEKIARSTQGVINKYGFVMRSVASEKFERVVYLGSHFLQGLARESALKLLELTDGETIAVHDSPMGFRHGPKTIINDRTLVVIFMSNHPYTRKYDLDLLRELQSDGRAKVIVISAQSIDSASAGQHLILDDMQDACDEDLLIPFMVGPQMLGFYQSLNLGYSPDNPDTSGMVNRVVQGVNIHAVT